MTTEDKKEIVEIVGNVVEEKVFPRFDEQEKRMVKLFVQAEKNTDRKIDELAIMMNGQFQKIDERFGNLENRMEGMEGRMEGMEGRMSGIEGRMSGLEERMDRIERKLDAEIERHDRLSVKSEDHGKRIGVLEVAGS
ncbi:MAG: hypothetical protein Q7S37_01530 [bacterium]|nr:hypothetical protein [bacterium]